MPNHVTNRLTVKGPTSDVSLMQQAVGLGKINFSCEQILPMPFGLRCHSAPNNNGARLMELYGAKDWYEWANKHWGTKWGVYDVGEWSKRFEHLDQFDNATVVEVVITFLSAWVPPIPVIVELSNYFPSLTFTIEAIDEGMGWALKHSVCYGETLVQEDITDKAGVKEMAEILES